MGSEAWKFPHWKLIRFMRHLWKRLGLRVLGRQEAKSHCAININMPDKFCKQDIQGLLLADGYSSSVQTTTYEGMWVTG